MQPDLGIAIGNSRIKWAWFHPDGSIEQTGSKPKIPTEQILPWLSLPTATRHQLLLEYLDLGTPDLAGRSIYLASVVPQQSQLWQTLPDVNTITLAHIPLNHLYPTLGIDRALAALGAGHTHGYPLLTIDGGTALTFTGIDGDRSLVGGAILPGVGLQFQALATGTAALPHLRLENLPPRWATNTQDAIVSGIIHTIGSSVADFITDWHRQFPDSWVVITGGDGELLDRYLQTHPSGLNLDRITCDRHLLFRGMAAIASLRQEGSSNLG
jgi:type III pantothenate kinase